MVRIQTYMYIVLSLILSDRAFKIKVSNSICSFISPYDNLHYFPPGSFVVAIYMQHLLLLAKRFFN